MTGLLRLAVIVKPMGATVLAGAFFTPFALASGLPTAGDILDACTRIAGATFSGGLPTDAVLHGIPFGILLLGLWIALAGRIRRGLKLRSALKRLPTRSLDPGDRFYEPAKACGALDRVRVLLTGDGTSVAFTAGLWRPLIYISPKVQTSLSPSECHALLLHELHHCRRRDPLRGLLITFAADVLFWAPLVRGWATRALCRIEFSADDAARPAGTRALALAIVKVSRMQQMAMAHGVAVSPFAVRDTADRRLRRLAGMCDTGCLPRTPVGSLVTTLVALAVVWSVGLASSASHSSHSAAETAAHRASAAHHGLSGC